MQIKPRLMSKRSLSEKMSCTVMYQPYAMSSSYSCDRPPAEKKAFRFPYVPSPPDSLHSDASSYSHSSPGPGNNSPSLGLTLPNQRRPLTPSGSALGASPPIPQSYSSASATVTSASLLQLQGLGLRSPHSLGRHASSTVTSATVTSAAGSSNSPSSSHSTTGGVSGNSQLLEGDDEDCGVVGPEGQEGRDRVQYLSATCVVYESYKEETERAVEEHFKRALHAPSSSKSTPMSTRNFPPSFFNSNLQPQSNSGGSKPFMNVGPYSASDFYGAAVAADYGSSLSGLSHHQGDPWHYPLASHQSYHHRSDLTYPPMPSTSRFNAAQYGSFFLGANSAASRFAGASQCGSNLKGESSSWASAGLYHHPHESLSELNLVDYAAHYTNRTAGLESTIVGQEASTSKDPYWF